MRNAAIIIFSALVLSTSGCAQGSRQLTRSATESGRASRPLFTLDGRALIGPGEEVENSGWSARLSPSGNRIVCLVQTMRESAKTWIHEGEPTPVMLDVHRLVVVDLATAQQRVIFETHTEEQDRGGIMDFGWADAGRVIAVAGRANAKTEIVSMVLRPGSAGRVQPKVVLTLKDSPPGNGVSVQGRMVLVERRFGYLEEHGWKRTSAEIYDGTSGRRLRSVTSATDSALSELSGEIGARPIAIAPSGQGALIASTDDKQVENLWWCSAGGTRHKMTDNRKGWGEFELIGWSRGRALVVLGFEERPAEFWVADTRTRHAARRPDLALPSDLGHCAAGRCVYPTERGLVVIPMGL